MPLSHFDICKTLQDQYDGKLVASDTVKQYAKDGDNFATIKTPDSFRILFEGSHDFLNWFYNFDDIMIYPPELNGVGVVSGFWKNLMTLFNAIESDLPSDVLISCEGHSRGAGMADQFAAMLACKGFTKLQCVTFGRPNVGDEALAKIHHGNISNTSYWNYGTWIEHDIVGDGPPHLLFPFTQTSPRTTIKAPPAPDDKWPDPLSWHHLYPNYMEGLLHGQS
jgi:hypothetical protein